MDDTTKRQPPVDKPRSAPPLTPYQRPPRPAADPKVEEGGPTGPEPTRYNDWERKGRVSDF
jgi:hypothetical protein